jgi:hypothetical protein
VGDKDYFDTLYRDLADGGTDEFLWLLQNLQLRSWHPRTTIKTEETAEQQRMSGDSVSQWAQACVFADAVIGLREPFGRRHDLGGPIASEDLRTAYTGFCRQQGLRPVGEIGFGKACAEMFGPRRRLPVEAPAANQIEDIGPPNESDKQLDEIVMRRSGDRTHIAPGAAPAQAAAAHAPRRPWGYDVPDGETWQQKIDARVGLRQ